MKKMLIAYYSWSNGNTKAIAEALQKATGADIVRLDTKVSYSDDYDAVVAQELPHGGTPWRLPFL